MTPLTPLVIPLVTPLGPMTPMTHPGALMAVDHDAARAAGPTAGRP